MTLLIKTFAAAAAATILATSAMAQSARDIRGGSPYIEIENEPAPKLIVDPPVPEGIAQGIFWAQYRVENVRIVPVFGAGALSVSPRVGHLHITVDDLPWWWADASDNNTVDIAGLPPGPHKVTIKLVDPNHKVFPGQVAVLEFTVPDHKRHSHLPSPPGRLKGPAGRPSGVHQSRRRKSLGVTPTVFRNAAAKEEGVWYPTDSATSVTGSAGSRSSAWALSMRSATSQSCGVRPVA